MSTKERLLSCQSIFWLLILFHQSIADVSLDFGSSKRSLEGPVSVPTSDLENPRLLCHLNCQERSCWNRCKGVNRDDLRKSSKQSRSKRNVVTEDDGFSSISTTARHLATEGNVFGSDFTSDGRVSRSSPDRDQVELKSTAALALRKTGNWTSNFKNISVTVDSNESGELFGDLQFWLSASEDSSNQTMIQVHMASNTCNYNSRFPVCKEPGHLRSYKIIADTNRLNTYRMMGLLFNAEYWIELTELEQRVDNSIRYRFITPGCAKTYRKKDKIIRCAGGLGRYRPRKTPQQSLLVEVVCVVYEGTGGGVDGGGGGVGDGGPVAVDIRWPVHPPDERWLTSVIVLELPDKNMVMSREIKQQEIRLHLSANTNYQILVNALLENIKRIVYHELYLNTFLDTLKGRDEQPGCPPLPIITTDTGSVGNVNTYGILLGVLAFFSLTIAGVVFFVRRKCRLGDSGDKHYKPSPSGQPLNPIDEWEIDPRDVTLGVEIGQGTFGRVFMGCYRDSEVAIKIMKDNIPELHRDDLLREIALMKGLGFHPNIVTMLGACTAREPIALIVEYMPFGNLQSFLNKCRIDREMEIPEKRNNVLYCLLDEMTGTKESWQITPTDILSFARQIVLAMQYLAERHYVHRDLAARNVLLGNNKVVKVCDFGLARLVYTGDQYFKLTSGRLPLKWMALESIRDRVFTTYSDVWSFGVLLWEMVTLGASPYPGVTLVDLYRLLSVGYRMQQPANCSDELYDIISQCWCENPTDRPNFSCIRGQLETLLAKNVNYLDLDNIDICLEHSEKSENTESNDHRLAASQHEDICIC